MPLPIVHDPLSILPHLPLMRLGTLTQPDHCLPAAGGLASPGPLTAMALTYFNSGKGGVPVPRPFLGGVQTGFHAMPQIGDDVMVLHEPKFRPMGSVSVTSQPTLLDVLQPGESFQRHLDGRIADYLKVDGSTTLYSDTAGTNLGISTAHAFTLNATPGITLNGPLTVDDQTLGGSFVLNGTVSGSTCTITIPNTWSLNINGSTHLVALLT